MTFRHPGSVRGRTPEPHRPEWEGSVFAFCKHRGTAVRVALGAAMLMAVETALFAGSSGVAVAAGKPAAAEQKTQETAQPEVTEAADIASATVAARLGGSRVEALSERTETSTTWVNPDGSLTTELSAGPVRYLSEGPAPPSWSRPAPRCPPAPGR
ncbi:hypothetical protein [Streptomyces sp. YIM 98790]|uniref:hypothetical protein n=1 Tax=Streptomyces sp. YIM 98790 TaxID=2689077 RepID=UPI0014072B99|nr:hypothetical protein [Streptomyces sp. YIM 98790]